MRTHPENARNEKNERRLGSRTGPTEPPAAHIASSIAATVPDLPVLDLMRSRRADCAVAFQSTESGDSRSATCATDRVKPDQIFGQVRCLRACAPEQYRREQRPASSNTQTTKREQYAPVVCSSSSGMLTQNCSKPTRDFLRAM